jgi:uncharacterized membrane-anchored protein
MQKLWRVKMLNPEQLWNTLKSSQLVSGDVPKDSEMSIPWYIRVMQGFAGWLAAIFLLVFFGVMFGQLFRQANSSLLMVVGLLCNAASYVIIKNDKNDFLSQFGMAVSLCGQLMFAIGLFWMFDFYRLNGVPFFMLAVYQIILSWLIPNFIHRFLTTVFGLLSFLIALNIFGVYGIGTALTAVVLAFIWLREEQWGTNRNFWEPIGFALATTIVISNGFLLSRKFLFYNFREEKSGWLFEHAAQLSSILISLVIINVVWTLLKEYRKNLDENSTRLALFASIVLVIISYKIFGMSAGLLVVILGFARQRISLMVLGSLAVLSFFSWYYYNLHVTLLVKSIYLVVMGAVFMFCWYVLPKLTHTLQTRNKDWFQLRSLSKQKLSAIAAVILVLVAVNFNIRGKQQLLKDGEIVLLKLAPVDPRSIMQGDFMRLRFDLQNKILNDKNRGSHEQGYIVVNRGENNLAVFEKIYNNEELKQNQFLIPYKIRNYRVILTTDAFYFQEGKAAHFQKAEYGEFRVSKDGDVLLSNMVDKDFKIL